MKWIVAPLLFVAANLSFAGDDAKDAAKKLIKDIEGEWKVEAGQKNGDNLPDEARQNLTLIFEGSKLFVRDQTGEKKEGEIAAPGIKQEPGAEVTPGAQFGLRLDRAASPKAAQPLPLAGGS